MDMHQNPPQIINKIVEEAGAKLYQAQSSFS